MGCCFPVPPQPYTPLEGHPNFNYVNLANPGDNAKSSLRKSSAVNSSIPFLDPARALATLPNEIQSQIVSKMFFDAFRHHKKQNKADLLTLLRAFCTALEETLQIELGMLLMNLPAAVLGDKSEMEDIRVFVDLHNDVRAAISSSSLTPPQKGLLEALQDSIEQGHSSLETLLLLFHALPSPHDRLKVALTSVLLSRTLPADRTKRMTLLSFILPKIDESRFHMSLEGEKKKEDQVEEV